MSAEVWTMVGSIAAAASVPLTAMFASRASKAAALAAAAPQTKQVDLAVLQATTERVDKENGELRNRQSRLEVLLRAFSWTCDRWAAQMRAAHIEPDAPHPLVEEYNRTGV